MAYTSTLEDVEWLLCILISIEKEMDITILDAEAGELETLQDLIDLVKQKVNGKEETSRG